MLTEEQQRTMRVSHASRVLAQFVEDHQARIRFGYRQRRMILRAANAGKSVTSYRVDWITSTARRIVSVLRGAGAEFNERFVWDAVNVDDLCDVLHNALEMLKPEDE